MSTFIWIACSGATNLLLCCLKSINVELGCLVKETERLGWVVTKVVTANGNTELSVHCPRCAPVLKAIRQNGYNAKTVRLARDTVEADPAGTRYALKGQAGECSRDMLTWTQDVYVLEDG